MQLLDRHGVLTREAVLAESVLSELASLRLACSTGLIARRALGTYELASVGPPRFARSMVPTSAMTASTPIAPAISHRVPCLALRTCGGSVGGPDRDSAAAGVFSVAAPHSGQNFAPCSAVPQSLQKAWS